MTSAKNEGVETPPPPLNSQNQKLVYPPSPLSEKIRKGLASFKGCVKVPNSCEQMLLPGVQTC